MSDFPDTCWTVVIQRAALHDDGRLDETASAALNALCESYWYPIYAYARAWGKNHHEAEDLTQTFFHELIANRWVARADRSKTKFRTFLLTHFKYVLSNAHRAEQAAKRGAGREHLSFDFENADDRFQALIAESEDPGLAYDRAWAAQVVHQTLAQLQTEYDRAKSSLPFDALRGFLPGGAALPHASYQDLAKQYGLSVDALKQRISRLNRRFRELLVGVVAGTLSDATQVQDEIRSLVSALAA
jgi:RNA polymerase sigma-70 factor (ECF subfamily)